MHGIGRYQLAADKPATPNHNQSSIRIFFHGPVVHNISNPIKSEDMLFHCVFECTLRESAQF